MIVDYNNTTHTLKIVPRYNTCNILTLTIKDSVLGTSTDITPTYRYMNGKLSFTFDYTFTDESRYQVYITDTSTEEIVYRGEFISTTQDTQKYQLTKDKYYY